MNNSDKDDTVKHDAAELSRVTEKTLGSSDAHDRWLEEFRSGENEPFFNLAFSRIAGILQPKDGEKILDAGCGSATKSIHLAKRGFSVVGIDFAEYIFDKAVAEAKKAGLADRITVKKDNLLDLSFADNSFEYALCWGVLMHIPDVEKAIEELSRIVKPGGYIVISEGNVSSVQAVLLRFLKKILGKQRAELRKTPAGLEHWEETDNGKLMTRQADISWLVREFEKHGLKLNSRFAGQFTEIYMIIMAVWIRKLIHVVNNIWFRFFSWPGPAYGNILIFKKTDSG